MGRIRTAAAVVDPTVTDAELAGLATGGDLEAFGELYRRHAQAAWRVAQAVTGNAEDSADAVSDAFTRVFKALPSGRLTANANFRAYLLTATRNAALDVHRRTGRVRSTGDDKVFDRPSGDGPTDKAMERLDAAMVATAFRSLPERWRSVLWLTEVEGIPAREAAGMLGVSANGVAQLAVRARAGLRERFLQAHITQRSVDDGCRATVERLGAYVAGALAPRELAKVDQHLAGCDECRARKEELEELGSNLRRIVLPIPLGLGAMAVAKWELASNGAAAAGSTAGGLPGWLEKAQRPLAVASVGLFAAGILGVGVVGQPESPRGGRARSGAVSPADLAAPAVTFTPAASFGASSTSGTGTDGFGSTSSGGSAATGDGGAEDGGGFNDDDSAAGDAALDSLSDSADSTGATVPTTIPTTPTTAPPTTPTTSPTTPTTAPPGPDAQVYVSAGGTAAVSVGTGPGSCTGTWVAGSCKPAPTSDTVAITTEGTKLPPPLQEHSQRL